eukprot:scpid12680/ scgid29690/ 
MSTVSGARHTCSVGNGWRMDLEPHLQLCAAWDFCCHAVMQAASLVHCREAVTARQRGILEWRCVATWHLHYTTLYMYSQPNFYFCLRYIFVALLLHAHNHASAAPAAGVTLIQFVTLHLAVTGQADRMMVMLSLYCLLPVLVC